MKIHHRRFPAREELNEKGIRARFDQSSSDANKDHGDEVDPKPGRQSEKEEIHSREKTPQKQHDALFEDIRE
jgi:hypothetical protein